MIKAEDISIVVQGDINLYTKAALLSIRSTFPGAQVILSTWEGSDISGLEYDKVIFSKDPGCTIIDDVSRISNNVNRQIGSTQAGVSLVETSYCLKTRSDIIWSKCDIIKFFGTFDVEAEAQYVQKRLLICNYYTRNPRVLPLPFHPSDWVVFGLTSDLRSLYDIEYQNQEEMRWFETRKRENLSFYTNLMVRFVPEQYICLKWISKFREINCECFYDASLENRRMTEEVLAKNFVVLDYESQLGIQFPKYNPNRYYEKYTLLSHQQWLELYQEYCLGSSRVCRISRCVRNTGYWFFFKIRTVLLAILHRLRLKEKVKRVLTIFNRKYR